MHEFSRRALVGALATAAVLVPRSRRAAAGESGTRVALKGYDPVAYFTDHTPEKGSPDFTASFDETTYWFKNAKHRALFVGDPAHYAPQFRGYCAIYVSRGQKYEADPEAWAIADGKLYVFSVKQGVPLFQKKGAEIIGQANGHWPALRAQQEQQ